MVLPIVVEVDFAAIHSCRVIAKDILCDNWLVIITHDYIVILSFLVPAQHTIK